MATDEDFAHTDEAARNRREKAIVLARFAWDRGITAEELLALSEDVRRKLARAAGAHPPRTMETWTLVARLLDEKSAWAAQHPDHPAASPTATDEKIMWVKKPPRRWL
ncbi:hypothetical protein D092_12525 [Rhodococcus ruber Chol-4]|jgi:hypothetical protein|uniref:Uncharacterized protein n=1 Tax=Rhodococcus ruber TaxID=1830 RepID=A0A098BU72_9NOCA|nr:MULTISPECIES: hypothetical protein [Rhodococcus]MDO2380782.1 hypothetical protein [Rhodococcus ruber]MDX5319296.1 hypothetical protein [Actinomycetes bacterium]RIK08757.1 MAG: hypothetical protein DCC47_15460 [Acidobacteriota bacterium]ATQ29401.1 hypothetical protein CS378_12165 [Rhodococcus ruber]AUM18416.1 hypothetical protein CSW53_18925 [Rhodococcus ruber]